MNKLIKELETKSFSGEDITDLLDNKTKIVTYPELQKYNSIDKLLSPYDNVVILYETKKNYGHWVCLIKHKKDNVIEFMDSYGLMPDDELKFVPMHFRISNDELKSHLTALLYNCPYDVEYNHYKLQKNTRDVNRKIATCGRHVAVRLLFRQLRLEPYIKLIKSIKCYDPDEVVTFLTFFK